MRPRGALAEWLGSGLQSRLQQFESARRLRTAARPVPYYSPVSVLFRKDRLHPRMRRGGVGFEVVFAASDGGHVVRSFGDRAQARAYARDLRQVPGAARLGRHAQEELCNRVAEDVVRRIEDADVMPPTW